MPISSSAPLLSSPPSLPSQHSGGERRRQRQQRSGPGAAGQRPDARATMLLRRVAAADDGSGAGVGRPRLFAVPRLLVGLGAPIRCGAGAAPDCDSPSPTSPLDLRARPFAGLGGGGSMLRSPRSPRARSWDSPHRLGLRGLVDDDAAALVEPGASNRLLGLGAHAGRQAFKLKPTTQPRDCAHASSPELGNVGTAAAASRKPVPCSRSYGDVKSGPEVTVPAAAAAPPGAGSISTDLGKFPAPGSLPASIGGGGGPRRYVGSVSATEVEQSEDYTCIIAHGPNPKTTRIFGDCILEPFVSDGDGVDAMEVKEGAESYWLVKCFDDGEPGEELLSSCVSCKKKLDANDSCVYSGEKAFCSRSCRDQEVLTEEEENITTAVSSLSSAGSSSSFNDDIFMAEMVVLPAPVDVHCL